jgi:release factor glutamine methyltransferase
VAVAIAKNAPHAELVATDLQTDALAVARKNVEHYQLTSRIRLVQGDLFEPFKPGDTFEIIVSNPPYIPTAEIGTLDADVQKHEPHSALDGGPDGLDVIRRIITQAKKYLSPGGALILELSPEQASDVSRLLTEAGYVGVESRKDLSGRPRVVLGRKPG